MFCSALNVASITNDNVHRRTARLVHCVIKHRLAALLGMDVAIEDDVHTVCHQHLFIQLAHAFNLLEVLRVSLVPACMQ